MDILNAHIVFNSLYYENPVLSFAYSETGSSDIKTICPLDFRTQLPESGILIAGAKRNDKEVFIYLEGTKQTYRYKLNTQYSPKMKLADLVFAKASKILEAEKATGVNLYLCVSPEMGELSEAQLTSVSFATSLLLYEIFKAEYWIKLELKFQL